MLSNKADVFIGCESSYPDAGIVLFGAPFDGTTSFRPGTRFGPRAIRADSFGIETYSPYQDADLLDLQVFDGGDIELPFGSAERALGMIEAQTAGILGDGKLPFMLGGEHLVTLGAVRAMAKRYPELHIIHLDAHADLRDEYLGEGLSHATVMRRCWELVGDGRIYQFGIRSGEKSEFEFAKRHTVMEKFGLCGLEAVTKKLGDKPVYLTIDLDVLDPSVFPGTGTPEPGGQPFMELFHAIMVMKQLNIVGCDLVELSPEYDHSGISTAAACKILRELLLIIGGK